MFFAFSRVVRAPAARPAMFAAAGVGYVWRDIRAPVRAAQGFASTETDA